MPASPTARTLALDLGTRTGWAIGDRNIAPVFGTLDLRGGRYEGGGMRFLRFRKHLHELLAGHLLVRRVVYEEVRRHLGTDAAHVYGGLMAVLQEECELRKLPYEGIPVGTIKKHATGKGNANKQQMLTAAACKWAFVKDDNQADALWLLDYVLEGSE